MMSDAERADWGRAMNALKQRKIDNISIWDLHTLIHYPDSAVGGNAAFEQKMQRSARRVVDANF